MVSVKKSELRGLKEKEEKINRKETIILLNSVFKNGLEFVPKYVDKTSKNYSSWE